MYEAEGFRDHVSDGESRGVLEGEVCSGRMDVLERRGIVAS